MSRKKIIRWTKKEIEFLIKNYPNQGLLWCSLKLNRSEASVSNKVSRLKLKSIREFRENLTGKRFGRWKVIKFACIDKASKHTWLCECKCGNKGVIRGESLRRGDSQSCGCLHKECTSEKKLHDLSGQTFFYLLVLYRDENRGKNKKYTSWKCRCICGYIITVIADNLISGQTQSCGCITIANRDKRRKMRRSNRNYRSRIYKDWRSKVFRRDNYTCQICGKKGGRMAVHHKDAWHWCISRRYEINNGVTLCGGKKGCHMAFHKIYGKMYNTEEQFLQFQSRYSKKKPLYKNKSNRI